MTKHPDLFAALAAPFDPSEVRVRSQQSRQFHYITARTAMNRLDEVLGPENWSDDYMPFGSAGVKCILTVLLPDGASITKTGIGGVTEMHDGSDTDKTGESDSLKRAAVKFGVARYLYRDGVPKFVQERTSVPAESEPARSAPAPDRRQDEPRGGGNGNGHASAGNGSSHGSNGHNNPPRSGKALFAWTRDQEQRYQVGLLKYVNGWAKLQEFPGRMVDWDPEQVSLAYAEMVRKLQAHTPTAQDGYEEALTN